MPKRSDLSDVLIIGAGPIVIGQACEFDYSGVQACKALREEGYRVILVNSNPATIMTDPDTADTIYIEPIEWRTLAKIIEKEKPDAVLPTMGGQTALNCAIDLKREGVLDKFGVQLIGASSDAIRKAEDRQLFRKAMEQIGLQSARSVIVKNWQQAQTAMQQLGFPIVLRPSYTLGGSGGGIAYNEVDFESLVKRGLALSPIGEVLLEESLLGWKEFEIEVVRDCSDNCIVICSIENFDPMGVHTGDSITVAPAQTLTDKEYQKMRNASISVLREIGVDTGGANVQFAVNPENGCMVVIEMNPRVSRSSALASKATGFPIAKVAAKLAVGYSLDELRNEITGDAMPASFEPTIDYVVTKIPRFDFNKFPQASNHLTTQMKSVGEAMAIGRTFKESLQKALSSLELGYAGLASLQEENADTDALLQCLQVATSERIHLIAAALRANINIDRIFALTAIDRWFLHQIAEIVDTERKIKEGTLSISDRQCLLELKQQGFADAHIAKLLAVREHEVYEQRQSFNLNASYKRVDSCAAEFDTKTAYLYSCYDKECEAQPSAKQKIIILGGGPNRIGQGIEFDYCCVHASFALREVGYETIMINCNPETVSTDYDISDRLYFEPLDFEHVMEVIKTESRNGDLKGVVVQYGGQTPLNLTQSLADAGVPIIGSSADTIALAEDRKLFQQLIQQLGLKQPPSGVALTESEALDIAARIGYPIIVRPSFVLGGRAMKIVYDEAELKHYMLEATQVSKDKPVLIDHFLSDAIEVDVDAICDGQNVLVGGIMQHIEQAGVHSGDSACSIPPYSLPIAVQSELTRQMKVIALALNIKGLMNAQFAIKGDAVYVIEVNPRASRTVPFVSKAIGLPLAKIAARCMVDIDLKEQGFVENDEGVYVVKQSAPSSFRFAVKEAVFPFNKFVGVDPILGPEMRSTGEVMGSGKSFGEAYAKAQLAAGNKLPRSGTVMISVRDADKKAVLEIAQSLIVKGFELAATHGTQRALTDAGIVCRPVYKVIEGLRPNVVDLIEQGQVSLVINTTEGRQAITDSLTIRSSAVQNRVCYTTTIAGACAIVEALEAADYDVYSL
ncbi:MAG: carbamoyl-phosphate synthase large subunit [Chromatiales bacterium]|nr:carbamoyl-phosphate synthase large subunit [Chromatiales bacterium]